MTDSTFMDVTASSPRQYANSLSQEDSYSRPASPSDSGFGYRYNYNDSYSHNNVNYNYSHPYDHDPIVHGSSEQSGLQSNDGIADFVDKAKTSTKTRTVAEQAFERTMKAYDEYERLADEFEAELHRREMVRQAEQAQAQAQLALARAQETPSRGSRGKKSKKSRAAAEAAAVAVAAAAKAAAAVVEAEATLPSPAPSVASASPPSASAHLHHDGLSTDHSGTDSTDSAVSTTASTPCRESVEPDLRRNKRKQHVPVHPSVLDRIPGVTLRIHSQLPHSPPPPQPLEQGEDDLLPFQRMTEKYQLQVEITKSLRDYNFTNMSIAETAPTLVPSQATSTTTTTTTSLVVSGQPLSWETLSSQEFVLNRVTGQGQIWREDEDRQDFNRLESALQTMLARQHRERHPDLYPVPTVEDLSMSLSETAVAEEGAEEETSRGKRSVAKTGSRATAKKVEPTAVSSSGRAMRATRRNAAATGHRGEVMAAAVQAQSTTSEENSSAMVTVAETDSTSATMTATATTATTTTAGGGLVEMYDDIERVLKAKRAKKREEKKRLQEEVDSMKRPVSDQVLDDKTSANVPKGSFTPSFKGDETSGRNNNNKRPLSLSISPSMTTALPQAQAQALKIRKLSCEPTQGGIDGGFTVNPNPDMDMEMEQTQPPSMSPPSPPHSRHGSPSKLGQSLSYDHGHCMTANVLHEEATEFRADETMDTDEYGLAGSSRAGNSVGCPDLLLVAKAPTVTTTMTAATTTTMAASTTATTPPATPTRVNADKVFLDPSTWLNLAKQQN